MHELQTELAKLNAKLAAEKAETCDVSLKTALAWWNVATTIRDLREMDKPSDPQQDHTKPGSDGFVKGPDGSLQPFDPWQR